MNKSFHFRLDGARCRRGGYSFAEIMFAVMILAIGFIMVAGIFPVAIQQQQATIEAVNAKEVAHNEAQLIANTQYFTKAGLPDTDISPLPNPAYATMATFYSSTPSHQNHTTTEVAAPATLWDSIKSNLIVSGSEHLAAIPVYSRESTGGFIAHLIVFSVQCRNASRFEYYYDTDAAPAGFEPNLAPKSVILAVTDGGANAPDTVTITSNPGYPSNYLAAVEGAYVVIADDKVTADNGLTPYNDAGYLNGRVAKLGTLVSSGVNSVTYEVAPGYDLIDNHTGHPEALGPSAEGYVIGRGYADTKDLVNGFRFTGPSMAIGRYTKLVSLP